MAAPMWILSSRHLLVPFFRFSAGKSLKKCSENNLLWYVHQPVPALTISRYYAKGKDRKKDKLKAVTVNEAVLSQVIKIDDFRNQLNRVTEKMKEDFVKSFTLRTSMGALDALEVDFDGTTYTLQDVAQIGKKGTNLHVIDLSTFPQVIPNVLKAIQQSGLGLNPQQDGTRLYIPVPKITKEHRETMSKNAKAVFIRTRDELRNVQNKFIKGTKNKDGISEDLIFSAKDQITAIVDQHIAEAEEILKSKQKELLG